MCSPPSRCGKTLHQPLGDGFAPVVTDEEVRNGTRSATTPCGPDYEMSTTDLDTRIALNPCSGMALTGSMLIAQDDPDAKRPPEKAKQNKSPSGLLSGRSLSRATAGMCS